MSIGLDFGVKFTDNPWLSTELFSSSVTSSSSSDADEDSHDEWGVNDLNKFLSTYIYVKMANDFENLHSEYSNLCKSYWDSYKQN